MDAADVCARRGGVATWSQLREAGVARRALAHAVASQQVFRVGRGLYALPRAPLVDCEEVRLGAVRTCVTALQSLGLPARTRDSRLHLAAAAGRSFGGRHAQPGRAVVMHYLPAVIAPSRSVITALDSSSRCLGPVDQLAAIDAALNKRMITLDDLDALRVTARRRREWLRRHCDPGAQSPPETWTRVALRTAGIQVQSQVNVPGVGRVDFIADGAVVVEVDGQTYHLDEQSFGRDRRRDRVAQIGGLMALRFTRREVEHEMAMVVDTVVSAVNVARARAGRRALAARGFVHR